MNSNMLFKNVCPLLCSRSQGIRAGIAQLLHRVQKYHSCGGSALHGHGLPKAWTVLRTAEEQLGFKLLHSSTGGKGGGGAVLSPEGELLLERYDELCRRMQAYGAQ